MKYTIRTPLPDAYNDQKSHAIVTDRSKHLVSVCRRDRASSWRKVKGAKITCLLCLRILSNLGVTA